MQPCRSAVASRLAVVETQEEIPFAVAGQRRRDEENLFAQHLLGCMEPAPRLVDGVQVLLWEEFLVRLRGGEISRLVLHRPKVVCS